MLFTFGFVAAFVGMDITPEGSVALFDRRPSRGGTWGPRAGQMAGASSSNAVANRISGAASTASS